MRIFAVLLLLSISACSNPTEEELIYNEKIKVWAELKQKFDALFSKYQPKNFMPNSTFDISDKYQYYVVTASNINDRSIELVQKELRELSQFLDSKFTSTEHQQNTTEFTDLKKIVDENIAYLDSFIGFSGIEELETKFLAVNYFVSRGGKNELNDLSKLVNWGNYFCLFENSGYSTGTPLRTLNAYRQQPNLYSDFPQQLKDYVFKHMDNYASVNEGRIRMRVDLGQYDSEGFLLTKLVDGINPRLADKDTGYIDGEGFFIQPDRGFSIRSGYVGQRLCASPSLGYGDIIGVNDKALNHDTGLLLKVNNIEEFIGNLKYLEVDQSTARQMVNGNKRYVYIDFYLENINAGNHDTIVESQKSFFNSKKRSLGVLEADLKGAVIYGHDKVKVRVSGGIANYGGGYRRVDQVGGALKVVKKGSDDEIKRWANEKQKLKTFIKSQLDFLDQNKKSKDIKTTNSGLQYKVIDSGEGSRIRGHNTLAVKFTGKLTDGTVVFGDNTIEPFKFKVNQAETLAWREAFPKMRMGAKWQIISPAKLAFGDAGRKERNIPPHAVIIYDVEVVGIE